jgi:hypothetical protein
MIPLMALMMTVVAPAPAIACPAVATQEVSAALLAVGEVGPWAVEGSVQPYPNVPYYECHFLSGLPKLNRQVLVQVRAADGGERTSIKHFVDQVSKTAVVPARAVAGLGDEAWFYIDADGVGQLNVRIGPAVVHVAMDLHTKGSSDAAKKLDAAKAVATHTLRRLKAGEISVTKK